jgi:hypothetical protein
VKTTLGQLRETIRQLLEFGVDDDLRNSAGFLAGGAGISNQHRDRENTLMNPPPGLGDDEQQDNDEDDEQRQLKGQAGARVYDREGGAAGSVVGRKSNRQDRNALLGEPHRW